MTTTSLRPVLITFVVSSFLFLSLFAVAGAQSCTAANAGTVCTGGKVCVQGTCRTPSGGDSTGSNTGGDTTGSNSAANTGGQTLVNPLKVDSLQGLLGLVIDAAVYIGTIVLVLALVYVGFMFVASRGNEEKIRDARRYFFWIVIGGLLVLGAKGLSEVIKSTATSLGS